MDRFWKTTGAACVAGALMAIAAGAPAQARHIVVDLGDGNFTSTGTSFFAFDTTEIDRRGDLPCDPPGSACAAYTLPFGVNFGAGPVTDFFIHENGVLSFGSALGAGFTPVASLSSLGAPVIAPFYADLTEGPINGDGFPDFGEIYFATGFADPYADALGFYDLADKVPAVRISWTELDVAGGGTASGQIILTDEGGGDFNLELLWGFFADQPALGSIAGFSLGANAVQFTGPYDATTASFWEFRGGSLVGGPPPPPPGVPEPATWLTLMLGLSGLGAVLRRRRRALVGAG